MKIPESLSGLTTEVKRVLDFELFKLNETSVTPASLLMVLVVVFAFFIISRIINRGLLRRVLHKTKIDPGIQYTMLRVSHYLVMIIGIIVAFQFVGIDLTGLAVIFGLLSVGIGFGLQNVTSNFVAGLILLFERPIKIGDRITVGDTEGDVVAIRMRATTIRSLRNISIIVPNSEFVSARVINWSHGDPKIRLDLSVGVSYGSDVDTVFRALNEVAKEHPKVLGSPAPDVLLDEFGDSSWNMRLRVWIAQPKRHYVIRSELNKAIVRKFREMGVEIPFPQRDLHVRSPLPVPLETRREEETK
jgi:small-conductance mechanosensitive channel